METTNDLCEEKITESSIRMLYDWSTQADIAIISAWRKQLCNIKHLEYTLLQVKDSDGNKKTIQDRYIFPLEEKCRRNAILKMTLLNKGYGVIAVEKKMGTGKEKDKVEKEESSFFVVDLHNDPDFYDVLFTLSELFNQDNFLYKRKGDVNAWLIGTNDTKSPQYDRKHKAGQIAFNKTEIVAMYPRHYTSYVLEKKGYVELVSSQNEPRPLHKKHRTFEDCEPTEVHLFKDNYKNLLENKWTMNGCELQERPTGFARQAFLYVYNDLLDGLILDV